MTSKYLKRVYLTFRAVIVTILVLAVVVPTLLYIALSLPVVQNFVRDLAETELSKTLDADVQIEKVIIQPFNRAQLRGVTVIEQGDTVMKVRRIGAGINLYDLLLRQKVSLTYAELIEPDVRLRRDSLNGPLNIQPIIDKLSSKKEKKEQSKIDFRFNTIIIRRGALSYDVDDQPRKTGQFDANHISINDLRADINAPEISPSKTRFNVDLRQFGFREASGFDLRQLHANISVTPQSISWSNLQLKMPGSFVKFADNSLKINSPLTIKEDIIANGFNLSLLRGSYVYLPDLKPFIGQLGTVPATFDIDFDLNVSPTRVAIDRFSLVDDLELINLQIVNGYIDNFTNPELLDFNIDNIRLQLGELFFEGLRHTRYVDNPRLDLVNSLTLVAEARGTLLEGTLNGASKINSGELSLDAFYRRSSLESPLNFAVNFSASNIDLNKVLDRRDMGKLNVTTELKGTIGRNVVDVGARLALKDFTFRGHTYPGLTAAGRYANGDFKGDISLADPDALVVANFDGSIRKGQERLRANAAVSNLNFNSLNLTDRYPGYTLSVNAAVDIEGLLPDRFNGSLLLSSINFETPTDKNFYLDSIEITANAKDAPRNIVLRSDLINGEINGDFNFATIAPELRSLTLGSLPLLSEVTEPNMAAGKNKNDSPSGISTTVYSGNRLPLSSNLFDFSFTIEDTEKLADYFNLPVSAIYPVSIEGNVDSGRGYASLFVDAPYIRQGNKLLESTMAMFVFTGQGEKDYLYATSSFPTADGLCAVVASGNSLDNHFNLDIDWKIDRQSRFDGKIKLNGDLFADQSNRLGAVVNFEESELVFNDSVWTIHPAEVTINPGKKVVVDNLLVNHGAQFARINGVASQLPSDTLRVDLRDIDLDYIFSTLRIDAVMLMGIATGSVEASQLFSPAPHLLTEGIRVKNIGYNGCMLGDALVKSRFDVPTKAVVLDGTIYQPNGKIAKVEGEIFPVSSSLDIRLYANDTPVGFMQKYMAAFASDISGHASGNARIFGTFHDIDMEGDLYVDNLRLKLDFTNAYFHASDSIHIRPGIIELANIKLRDPEGNSAILNGRVTHDFFRDPEFDFRITDARNLLVYNETIKDNPDWFGKVYVDGGAAVDGKPGIVNINVDARTAPGSVFTYVMSEMEIADEYTFLTFRDKNRRDEVGEEVLVDTKMALVDDFREKHKKNQLVAPTNYVIELKVDITPAAEVDLIMDPVAGDLITTHGAGSMRMVYTSSDDNLEMYGRYTLSEGGKYKFTLQDIILKDFIIEPGSYIAFDGDPLQARLHVVAYYEVRTSLSDLDESFLQDKDLARTNVPVRAILMVDGNLDHQDFKFDLQFPTLTSDVYNKVRSIVSTEDMMSRQIIYLLALGRFYTPDYMGSTTSGNELFSVASSTITSQLSNILGGLSDNLTVQPNLRSDNGDFSDVEVDVALTSRLLNNRLLLNGNFGYRDNSLNTSQFIGDFEAQYLLNRAGTIRLKAYSHSNDENYYVRTAATTQGVGVLFRRDFDNIWNPFRRKKKSLPTDSVKVSADSVKVFTDSIRINTDSIRIDTDFIRIDTDSVKLPADSVLIIPAVKEEAGDAED